MALVVPALSVVSATISVILALIAFRFATTPGWHDQRWFALVTASASGYSACNIAITLPVPNYVILGFAQAGGVLVALHVGAWILHTCAHLHVTLTRTHRAALGVCALAGVASLIPGLCFANVIQRHHVDWLTATYAEPRPTGVGVFSLAMLGLLFLLPVRDALRQLKKRPDAKVHVGVLVALMLAGVNDAVASTGRASIPYLADVAFIFALGAIGVGLIRRFITGAERLEILSTKLEAMVAERTRELGEAQSALAKAERLASIGRLAAGVAHEINNPAVAVISNLTYLEGALHKSRALPDDAEEALRDSGESMRRIARIVRQLLDTGRIANAGAATRQTLDVKQVINSAAATARASVAGHVAITIDIPSPVYATAEPLSLEQVLLNLMANSAQAIGPTRRDGRIQVRTISRAGRVQILVSDNGGGMTQDISQRAFEPFFTTKAFGTGTGLGLSVSLGLVRAVNGDLRIESTSEAGTTMVLELESGHSPPHARGPTPVPRGNRRKRLLVIDDERAVRDGLRRMLSELYDVETAHDASDGLDRLLSADASFDAILCDVMMGQGSGSGGFLVWQRLNAEQPTLAARLIFVTGGVNERAQTLLSECARPVLYKPLSLGTVAQAVEQLV